MSDLLAELYTACVVEYAREKPDKVLAGPFGVIGKDARDAFNLAYDEEVFREVIEVLEGLGALKVYRNPGMQTYYRLDVDRFDQAFKFSSLVRSYQVVQTFDEERVTYPFLESYSDLGRDFLLDALEAHEPELAIVGTVASPKIDIDENGDLFVQDLRAKVAPAADRLVNLSHNQELVSQADGYIEGAVDVITSSNSLDPEIKGLWISLLERGREYLKKPSTYIAVISALLVKPLYDAYSSALEESSKPVISSALDAVMALVRLQ